MPSDGLASGDSGAPTSPRSIAECWVFDVDGCLVDSLTGTSLRPGALDLLEHLAQSGRHIILWSAGGDAYARARAEQFGVDHLVSGYFAKDGRDDEGCYLTAHLPLQDRQAVFVDDRPDDLARDLDVVAVSPYLSDDPHDHGLQHVARRAGLVEPRTRQ
jgi:phosphoglycolate phosphatase-like HAD superfamily hydrolase